MVLSSMPHRLSRIFQPVSVVPKNSEVKHHDITSKSQKLMLDLGIIRAATPGCFHFLPLGVRALEKLIKLVDREMQQIGGQKMIFPTFTNAKLWETTGRLQSVSKELFKLNDRHNHSYILSPTHEEAAGDLLASVAPVSYKQCPLRLYQITSKFRDEMKPRFGLMRGRQFLMKDMYSFDTTLENAEHTYRDVCGSYDRLFTQLGVDFSKVLASSGAIGGSLSHEYHFHAEIGEDQILHCSKCNYKENVELNSGDMCPKCESKDINRTPGIEVGHTFLLGDRYSKPLNATFLRQDGKPTVLQMGSYGLGLSRIIAAALEVLSNENELRWPLKLAPYKVVVLPPKDGSKEELAAKKYITNLYERIEHIPGMDDNVLLDDRTQLTIGKRYLDAKRVGYPFIVVLGRKINENPPLFEVNNLCNGDQLYLSENELLQYFQKMSI